MARKHFARAIVSQKNVAFDAWMETLRNQHEGAVPRDHVHRIAKNVLRKCNPNQYLLSHATIVASVDTYAPKKVKLGKQMNSGIEIDVRWPNFRVKPECHDIINNNGDAWERSLLLSTYRTFIGAQNYLEHIQLPELSKGFIVDAIARDLGKTAYIDILVATDRKHAQLIRDIQSGKIDSMSMGCHVPGTQVYLSDGTPINIEDVRPDMEVLSQKGNSCRVDNLQIRENRWSVQTIKSVGLPSITSTDNHNYYIVRKESVEYNRIRNKYGHKSRPQVVEKDYDFDYAEAGTIRVGDFLAFPISQDVVVPTVSLSEARLLGLWVGDGWKFENKHDSTVGIGFCLDESYPDIVQDVTQILDQIAWKGREFHMAVGGNPVRSNSTNVKHRRGAAYLTNTSRAVRHLVDEHVIGRTSSTKVISKSVMNWPVEHQMAFLSGLIDSDGCVSSTKRGTKNVFLSTRNKHLAHQYMQIAARCGIVPTLSVVERKGTRKLPNASGTDYQIKLRNSDVVHVPSLKVRAALQDIKPTQTGRNNRWITPKYIYSEVRSISRSEHEGFVYDLQVDQDHSYVANGVGVSNCISLFTTCSRCGNVAADDSQVCPCISYMGKHAKFVDEEGVNQVVCELIGNVAVPNSNQFIEASWVGNPAFRGAVRRNILNPDEVKLAAQLQEAELVAKIRSQVQVPDGIAKAASLRIAEGEESEADSDESGDAEGSGDDAPSFDLDSALDGSSDSGGDSESDADDSGIDAPDSPPADSTDSKIDSMLESVQEQILQSIAERLAERLAPKPEDVGSVSIPAPDLVSGPNSNDNLVRSSEEFARRVSKKFAATPRLVRWAIRNYCIVHIGGRKAIASRGLTAKDLLVLSWIEDRVRGIDYSSSLYKTAMAVGSINRYPSSGSFLAACKRQLGRELTASEKQFFTRKGRIASIAKP